MPYDIYLSVKNPVKLQDKCLQIIAKNFEKILLQRNSDINLRCLQRKSQHLLQAFKEIEKHVSLQHALFCLPHLKELDFNWFQECDTLQIVRTLGTVENAITVLNARYVSLVVLRELLPLLPKTLKSLNLQQTRMIDNGLGIITRRCPNLQELDIQDCVPIGDDRLKDLCPKDEQGNIRPNLILQKLKMSVFSEIRITGVEFILNNCPNLSEFEHDYVLEVIYKKYSRAVSSGNLENEARYNLKSVQSTLEYSSGKYLKSFSVLCPLIRNLSVAINSQEQLDICAEFSSLIDVKFVIHESCNLLFFLQARGRNLKNLEICVRSCNFSISSEMLVEFCPNLERLSLDETKFVKVNTITNLSRQNNLFSLAELIIYHAYPDYLEESMIYILSRSPSLKEFTFWNRVSFVSSSFVSSLISCKAMSTLKEVDMSNVDIDFKELKDAFQNINKSGGILEMY